MIESRLRTLQLGLAGFSFVGLFVELLLQSHHQVALQWTPLVLMSLGAIGVVLGLVIASRWAVIYLRTVGTLIAAGAALGVFLHLSAAMSAEREWMGDDAAFGEVLRSALEIYTPPLLAPGAMAVGGLLLIASTYGHPAMRRSAGS